MAEPLTNISDEITNAVTETSLAYGSSADAYNQTAVPFNEYVMYPILMRLLEQAMGHFRDKKLLDIGCGAGRLIEICESQKMACKGIDITEEFVDEATARGLDVCHGSMHNMPFESNSFDCVVSNFALNYLPLMGQEQGLNEMCRVLRPGGVAVFSYHHPFGMRIAPFCHNKPNYVGITDSYFKPIQTKVIELLGTRFTIYLSDWPDLVNMVCRSGLRVKELVDPPVPAILDDIIRELTDDGAIQFAESFRNNPYALYVLVQKPFNN